MKLNFELIEEERKRYGAEHGPQINYRLTDKYKEHDSVGIVFKASLGARYDGDAIVSFGEDICWHPLEKYLLPEPSVVKLARVYELATDIRASNSALMPIQATSYGLQIARAEAADDLVEMTRLIMAALPE